MALQLRNPHSVLAALETRPQDVVEIRSTSKNPAGAWAEVLHAAKRQRIPIVEGGTPRQTGGRRSRQESKNKAGRLGTFEATVKEHPGTSLKELLPRQTEQAEPGLWLALDCLQDPHNVGAIFRSAAFFGVRGVVITKDRSAPLTATVYDVASGGLEYVPFSVQTNLSRCLDEAKNSGLWVLGTSEHADLDVAQVERDRSWLLVLGNEERGMRRLTQEKCDVICRLSPRGPVTSLNVSVASGILIAALTSGI